MDIDKELYEKMNQYDRIIGSCMVNTYSLSKDGWIILRHFNKNSDIDMFEFEVAKMVQDIYRDRQIYLDMNFISYLIFKFKNRKKVKLKWISREDAERTELKVKEMLTYVATSYNYKENEVDYLYTDIYNLYWKNRGELNA